MIRRAAILLALSALFLGCSAAPYKISSAVTPGGSDDAHKLPALCCPMRLEWSEDIPTGVEPGYQWSGTPVDYVQVDVRSIFAASVRLYAPPTTQPKPILPQPVTVAFQRITHRYSLSMETGRMFATWEFAAEAGVTCSTGRTLGSARYTARSERFKTTFLGGNKEVEEALRTAATQAALKLMNMIGNACLTGSG